MYIKYAKGKKKTGRKSILLPCVLPSDTYQSKYLLLSCVLQTVAQTRSLTTPHYQRPPNLRNTEVISWFFRNGFCSSDKRQHSGFLQWYLRVTSLISKGGSQVSSRGGTPTSYLRSCSYMCETCSHVNGRIETTCVKERGPDENIWA